MKSRGKLHFIFLVILTVGIGQFIALVFSNKPQRVKAIGDSVSLVKILSGDKTRFFETRHTYQALFEAKNRLSKRTGCPLHPVLFDQHPQKIEPRLMKGLTEGSVVDLRQEMWELKSEFLDPQDCMRIQDGKLPAAGNTIEPFSNQPLLLETVIPERHLSGTNYLLSVGLINGTGLILVNDEPVAFFQDRSQSDRLVSVKLNQGKPNKVSLIMQSSGFRMPGIAIRDFVGLLRHDVAPERIVAQASRDRDQVNSLSIYVTIFLAFVLILFGWFNQTSGHRFLSLALVIACYGSLRSLELDLVQSTLSGDAIRYLRETILAIATSSILLLTSDSLIAGATLLTSAFSKMRRHWVRCSDLLEEKSHFILYSLISLYLLVRIIGSLGSAQSPPSPAMQFSILVSILNWCLKFGFLLLSIAAVMFYGRRRINEDQQALHTTESLNRLAVGGLGLTVYAGSLTILLDNLYYMQSQVHLPLIFNSLTFPLAVTFVVFFLVAKTLQDQVVFAKILPESILEMVGRGAPEIANLDHTSTEYNWIMLNDLAGSSALKLRNLSIVTHLLQSVFHKVHKDYFDGAIHFVNSIGDAMLLTIKTPLLPANADPILEKLVRCYALHSDGVQSLKENYEVISAILKMDNEELFLALQSREEAKIKADGAPFGDFHFRTMLTSDFYYYGLNHALSNVDSRSIYLMAKSEKHIKDASEGGFLVFPELMPLLKASLLGIEEFFVECEVDKEKVSPRLRDLLPSGVFVLRIDRQQEFEGFLRERYGKDLFLRNAADSGVSYTEIASSVLSFCEKHLKTVSSTEELLQILKARPVTQNFAEKNHLIKAISDAATRSKFWQNPAQAEAIKDIVREIGIPAANLINAIGKKDERNEPESILQKLKSSDTLERNRAVRFLRLARVRSPFRPTAMAGKDFMRQVLETYLSRYERYSVESHVYLYLQFSENAKYAQVLRAALKDPALREKFAAAMRFFSSTGIESLRSLTAHYGRLLGSDETLKAA